MLNFFIKFSSIIIFSIIVIFFYYWAFPGHYENTNFIFSYFIFFAIFFWVYKIIQYFLTKKDENIIFSWYKIFYLFLVFLFFTCVFYFSDFSFSFRENFLPNLKIDLDFDTFSKWLKLFLRIIIFSLLPIFIFLISASFWEKISKKLPKIDFFWKKTRILFSLNLWFFSFLTILTIFSFFWIYNFYLVLAILSTFFIFSFREFFHFLKIFYFNKIIIPKNPKLKLFISEFFYFFSFFCLSVGLIYIVRPFPRWWDEVSVYMNFPNILAYSWWNANFWEMYSWQIFTWIWYFLKEPVFAYFLNFSWYFLSFLTLNFIFSEIFKNKKNSILDIKIMLSSLFLALPMTIFQSIKDLKLDQGLFFITSFLVYFFFLNLKNLKNDKNFPKIYIFIIWILTGFAFSIKFTSLFLIISFLACFCYFFLWFFWFFWFLSLFFAVFSFWNLWQMMNIYINFNIFWTIFSLIFWIFLLFLWILKHKNPKLFFKTIALFLSWIFLSLLPWFIKNIFEIYPKITISWIIKWKNYGFSPDLKDIFSKQELDLKNEEKVLEAKKEKITTNEDLRRFLWYESWVFPYLNIFWNVSMQKNQWWKFTEIWYLFFLFLPIIFIFLPFFRKKDFYLFFIFISFFQIIFYIEKPVFVEKNLQLQNLKKENFEKIFTENISWKIKFIDSDLEKLKKNIEFFDKSEKQKILEIWLSNRDFFQIFKDNLAKMQVPFSYFFIFFVFFIFVFLVIFNLKKSKKTFIFELNLIFSFIYIFLWIISSFGIVWYGITIYFSLLLFIWCGFFHISDSKNILKNNVWEAIILAIFLSYFVFSLIPHSFSNFIEKNYTNYKLWKKSSLQQIFDLHNDYEEIFFELNVADQKKKDFLDGKNNILEKIDLLKIKQENGNLKAKKDLENIYKNILYPEEKYENLSKIYRIWTFLKFYIYKNDKRVFEDWLLFYFNYYLNEKSAEKTWENFKKLWFKYIILDLWTATIDDSKNHLLTKRYEKFLKKLSSEKLELFKTDSICLRFATDLEKIEKNNERFFALSSGTYESYDEKGREISRDKKTKNCILEIEKFVNNPDFEAKKFPYLKKYIWENALEIEKNFEKWRYAIYKIK